MDELLYKIIDENTIEGYDGGILKKYDGQNLISVVANPTADDLKNFGYKPLIDEGIPEYNEKTQYVTIKYTEDDNNITTVYEVINKEDSQEVESISEVE